MISFSKFLIAGTLLLSGGLSPLAMATEAAIVQTTIAQTDTRTQAQQLFDEGMQLFNRGTAESLRQALFKWEAALPLWRELGDKSSEAYTLLGIGFIYNNLGEKNKALDYFIQALAIYRAISDRKQEAVTLNNIGRVCEDLGEKEKALDYYNQSLSLRQAAGDHKGEASTLNNIGAVYDALGEKEKALDYYNQSLPLRRAVGDYKGEAVTLNNIGGIYSDLGEKQEALDYLNQSLPLSRAAGERAIEATTLNNMGQVYSDLGEKEKALDYFNQSLPLRRAVGDHKGEAVTLNNMGQVYSDLGEKEKALDYFNQSLPLSQAAGDRTQEATILNNMGQVYSDLGEKEKALNYFNQSLPLSRAVGDRKGEAATLNNMGQVYSDLGEKEKALDYFNNQSLPLLRAVGDRAGEAVTLSNMGQVYSDLGEKQKALDYYNQSLLLSRAASDRAGEAVTLSNIGIVYNALGEKKKALEYYNQSLPLSRAASDLGGEATTLNNIGGVYDDLGEKRKALEYYNQSLPLLRAADERAIEATTLNNIGGIYGDLGEKQKALDYFNQSLSLHRAVGDHSGEATTLNNIGTVHNSLGEKRKALEYYNQSLPLLRDVGDRSGEATSLNNIADLEANRGNLQAALVSIQVSIEIIEDLRTKVISPELRQTYFSTVQHRYQLCINILMELHEQNPSLDYDKQAFYYSERSRARTLLELLTEANVNIKEGIDPKLLAQEKSLRGQLNAIEKQRLDIFNNPKSTTEQKIAIDQKHETLLEQEQDLQNEIRQKSPNYAGINNPEPLTLEQVQQQILDENTVLLQYSLGKEKSYLWVVTKEGMSSYQLPSQKEIEKHATNLLRSIKQSTNNPNTFAQAEPLLSQVILAPAKDKLTKKRIVIVADGVLQYIPFAALSLSEDRKPIITQYEIVNLPSSSSLAIIRNKTQARGSAPKTLAILANPVFSKDDKRVQNGKTTLSQEQSTDLNLLALNRSVRSLEDGKLDPLPGTRQEAEAILKLVLENTQKTSAFDFDANLDAAINPELSQYRIVHFATHGILNTESPDKSGVVLSLVDKNGNSVNGFLRLNEIFNLNLPADLVVISACETGLGKEIKGEGLVGLTRGFMYAGSPRLLVSLWKVDDKATAAFMTRFYKLMLEKKLPPAEALREAQLEMQQETEWKSPYYWSAFVLQGEWR